MRRGRPKHPEVLTPREQQVLAGLQDGFTNAEIAVRLGISPDGVKYHVSEILSKLGVSSRQDAVAWAHSSGHTRRFGILSLPTAGWRPLVARSVIGGSALVVAVLLAVVVISLFRADDAVQPGLGKLAYIVDGNLWIKDLPQGTPHQLTKNGLSWNPRWSASGKWLADGYVAGQQTSGRPRRDADIISADGKTRRFATGCGVWSPIRDELVCWGASTVRVEAPDGAVASRFDIGPLVRKAANVSLADVTGCVWSPDGMYLICGVSEVGHSGTPPSQYSGIWTFSRDGAEQHEVFRSNAYAPDGGYVVLLGIGRDAGSPGSFTVGFTLMGGTACNESFFCVVDSLPIYQVPLLGGSVRHPEGRYFYTTAGTIQGNQRSEDSMPVLSAGAGRETWTNKRIALVPYSGPLIYLTDQQAASIAPYWSPDGARIVYVSGPDAGSLGGEGASAWTGQDAVRGAVFQRKLWLMAGDGSDKTQLTRDAAYRDERPYWSHNGQQILFGRLDHEGAASVWFISPADGSLQKLADVSAPKPRGGLVLPFTRDDYFKRFWDFYGIIPWQFLYSWWQPQTSAITQ